MEEKGDTLSSNHPGKCFCFMWHIDLRVSVYLIAGFRKRVEEMSKWGPVAWRADVVSPFLLMVLNVQFGER